MVVGGEEEASGRGADNESPYRTIGSISKINGYGIFTAKTRAKPSNNRHYGA